MLLKYSRVKGREKRRNIEAIPNRMCWNYVEIYHHKI